MPDRSPPCRRTEAGAVCPRVLPHHLGDDAGVEPVGGAHLPGGPAQDTGGGGGGHGAGGRACRLLQVWWV